jgi:pilus assembly protein CpaB
VVQNKEAATGAAQEKRSRRNAFRAVVFLVLAIICAVGAAALLTRYMDARTAAMRVPTTQLVVAAVDIPVASAIKPEWLTTVEWPVVSKPDGSTSDAQQIVGKIATSPIVKGEPLLASKLTASEGHSGLSTLLPAGTRAVAVRVDDVVGVAGFIHPNDHVDVICTMQFKDQAPFASKVILQNVRVLAVGQDLQHRGKTAEQAVPVTVATLMVDPDQAERLALASVRGRLLLALRGATDGEIAATSGAIPAVMFASTVQEPAPMPAPAHAPARHEKRRQTVVASAPVQPKVREKQSVEILRGDLFEKRDFEKAEQK